MRKPARPRAAATDAPGNVVEIFSGIQGEGLHVGRRHIFLRLAGCNLSCDYCDQPEARTVHAAAAVERIPGRRDFVSVLNPIPTPEVARAVLRLHRPGGLHHALAVTGGEPLLQPEFLAALLPSIRRQGLPVILETNGTRPDALKPLLPYLDIVSMDFKLKSATGRPAPVRVHSRFLTIAVRHGVETYVKAVVASATTAREISRLANVIATVKKSLPLVLQPVTRHHQGGPRPPTPSQLLLLQEAAAKALADVRVIPQTHKILKQR